MKIILATLFSFLLSVGPVWAADLDVSCSGSGPCTTVPSDSRALFDSSNWAPGDTDTKSIAITNTDTVDSCAITLTVTDALPTPGIAAKLFTAITSPSTTIYGNSSNGNADSTKSLLDLYNQKTINFDTLPAQNTRQYNWLLTLDPQADNDYQNKKTVFDFSLNFACGTAPTVTPTPTTAPSSGGGVGGLSSVASPPGCNDQKPDGAPALLSATPGVNSVTLVWSTEPKPLSYYLIAFGTISGSYLYGNPDIGGSGTTSYRIDGLSAGTQYYFVVRGGNGCAPGPFSNELSAIPSGIVLANPVPVGFIPGVLGTETEAGQLGGGIASEAGSVAGTNSKHVSLFWWLGVLILILIGLLFYLKNRQAVANRNR